MGDTHQTTLWPRQMVLKGHGCQRRYILIKLLIRPIRAAMRLKYGATTGARVEPGNAIIFVIASNVRQPDKAACLNKTQTIARAWAAIDNITGDNNMIELPLFQVLSPPAKQRNSMNISQTANFIFFSDC
jgi:hypothetical protein